MAGEGFPEQGQAELGQARRGAAGKRAKAAVAPSQKRSEDQARAEVDRLLADMKAWTARIEAEKPARAAAAARRREEIADNLRKIDEAPARIDVLFDALASR